MLALTTFFNIHSYETNKKKLHYFKKDWISISVLLELEGGKEKILIYEEKLGNWANHNIIQVQHHYGYWTRASLAGESKKYWWQKILYYNELLAVLQWL